jgi:hypothetical protein
MSLWYLGKKAPCLNYTPWDGEVHPIHYNDWLVTPPRLFQESVYSIPSFFFLPGNDILVSFIWFSTYHWPSWSHERLEWDANTGEFLQRTWVPIWGSVYSRGATLGSYEAIYSTYIDAYDVYEIDWETLSPRTWKWTCPKPIAFYCLINREDDRAMALSSWYADIYRMSTSEKTGSLRFPTAQNQIAWESRTHAWVINPNGTIFKINYRAPKPRFELMSSVQNPEPTAQGYRIAFDTRRNRIAVLRWLPDAADGACNLQIEFYRPLVKVAADGLTDPVPVTPVKAGEKARFVAHLHGEQGEGLGAYFIDAELEAPATGDLITPVAPTLVSGEAVFGYQAPLDGGGQQDTLRLHASIAQDGS